MKCSAMQSSCSGVSFGSSWPSQAGNGKGIRRLPGRAVQVPSADGVDCAPACSLNHCRRVSPLPETISANVCNYNWRSVEILFDEFQQQSSVALNAGVQAPEVSWNRTLVKRQDGASLSHDDDGITTAKRVS